MKAPWPLLYTNGSSDVGSMESPLEAMVEVMLLYAERIVTLMADRGRGEPSMNCMLTLRSC